MTYLNELRLRLVVRVFVSMDQAEKHHHIRITASTQEDLASGNGVAKMNLFTNTSGTLSYGAYVGAGPSSGGFYSRSQGTALLFMFEKVNLGKML